MNTSCAEDCASAEHVDAMLRRGEAGLLRYGAVEAEERAFLEYWLHAVPGRAFLDFLACTPGPVLAHHFCDVRFACFLRQHTGASTALYTPPEPHLSWMYFHRQHAGQVTRGLRSSATVGPEDVEAAIRLRRLGALQGPGEGAVAAAATVAEIRRDVEMLVLYGQVAPEDIAQATLHRQGLAGGPDAAAWAGLAEALAAEVAPVLAPPPGGGTVGRYFAV